MTANKQLDVDATGKRIDELRKACGLTVRNVADSLGITVMSYYKWKSGKCMPTIDNLVLLAHIFGVNIDDIIRVSDIN